MSSPDVQNMWTTCFNNLRPDTHPIRQERSQTHPGVGGKSNTQQEFWFWVLLLSTWKSLLMISAFTRDGNMGISSWESQCWGARHGPSRCFSLTLVFDNGLSFCTRIPMWAVASWNETARWLATPSQHWCNCLGDAGESQLRELKWVKNSSVRWRKQLHYRNWGTVKHKRSEIGTSG